MAGQASVLDDMDDLTAALSVCLQLEDTTALAATLLPSDTKDAVQHYGVELRAYRADRGLREIVRMDCSGCFRRFTSEEGAIAPCSHSYCYECLEQHFSSALRDKTLYPPRCCHQPIPWDTVRHGVSNLLAVEFEAKKEELDDKNPLYCHDKHCSEYIKVGNISESAEAFCSSCWAVTCTLCRQKHHQGACPQDEEIQKMRAYAKDKGYRECTQCNQLVELSTGCNHITCLCEHEFCYCCGITWKNCPCEHFEEENLVERANEVANRPGMGGAAAAPAIAEQLRRDHQVCDNNGHGYMDKIEDGDLGCEMCGQEQDRFVFRCFTCHTQLCYRCKNFRA